MMILIQHSSWKDLRQCSENNEKSFYLQSKVYFAKEFLMQDYPPELNVSKYNPSEDADEEGNGEGEKEAKEENKKEDKK